MHWRPAIRGKSLGIDWSDRFGQAIDPYLIWADLSGFQGVAVQSAGSNPKAKSSTLRLALEIDEQVTEVGVSYNETVCWAGSRYATASVPLDAVAGLLNQPAVKRIELGFLGRHPPRTKTHLRQDKRVAGPVLAVIDFGCAFAHEHFHHRVRGGRRTRIEYLWDQSRPAPTTGPASTVWHDVADQGYGRELTSLAIDSLIQAHTKDDRVDEDTLYRCADYDSVATLMTHGNHVLDLAAGAPPESASKLAPKIIFVQLPDFAVNDTSGGSMVTNVMDAVRYILNRTQADAPLVINLSYGSMAGPHDGSTILESALDAVIARAMGARLAPHPERYLSIVLPAGNNFESDGHAVVRLDAARRSQMLEWQVMCDDPTDTFLELWYPRAFAGCISVTVKPPGGPASETPIDAINALSGSKASDPICAVIHRRHSAGGMNDAMALVALAPTSGSGSRTLAPAGVWQITVSFVPAATVDAPVEVHAWIERDDPPIGSGAPPRQSRFLTDRVPLAANEDSPVAGVVQRGATCSSIANGTHTVVVGACTANAESIEFARYSSSGPTRNKAREAWPDLVVVADESRSLPGIPAAGTRSGVQVRMNGTSVAAPQVARQLIQQFLPYPRRPRAGPGETPLPVKPNGTLLDKLEPVAPGVNLFRAGRGRLKSSP